MLRKKKINKNWHQFYTSSKTNSPHERAHTAPHWQMQIRVAFLPLLGRSPHHRLNLHRTDIRTPPGREVSVWSVTLRSVIVPTFYSRIHPVRFPFIVTVIRRSYKTSDAYNVECHSCLLARDSVFLRSRDRDRRVSRTFIYCGSLCSRASESASEKERQWKGGGRDLRCEIPELGATTDARCLWPRSLSLMYTRSKVRTKLECLSRAIFSQRSREKN